MPTASFRTLKSRISAAIRLWKEWRSISFPRARQMERGYSLLIVGGRIAKRGQDEEVYYNHTEVTSHDKEVSVKLAMPRSELSPLLLKYSAAKK